ncbi:DUF6111 family protein [Pyruvatibacter sp.]|uniref:DUF6111 family protein n=1 Tax=Pyruvatibacter sp. TaxID=1981328 RepID=UPI003262D20A
MLRIVLIQLLLFAIPFIVWALYVLMVQRRSLASGGAFNDAPIAWLLGAGTAMVAAGLVYLAVFSGTPAGEGQYVPPRLENGQIVPGHIEPAGNTPVETE